MTHDAPSNRRGAVLRVAAVALGVLLLLAVGVYSAFRFTPWPSALLVRRAFTADGRRIADALAKHVPAGVTARRDLSYDPADPDARFDVFSPDRPDSSGPRPTVVWIHGGAFVAGSKDEIANYLQILAARGFTVVGVNYSLAPGRRYPTPVRQVERALAYLAANAAAYRIDPARLFLAGDSGGAQIAAQLALVLSDSTYAARVGIRPTTDIRVRGAILCCGPYDIRSVRLDGPFGRFLTTVLWAYSGTRQFMADSTFATISVVRYVAPGFPPTFLTVGNADPLAPLSRAFAGALVGAGVQVDTLFYPADHPTPLPHEYQFDLDIPEGRQALERIVAFLDSRS